MNLLNTPVIRASEDVWWAPPPGEWGELKPARAVVIAPAPVSEAAEGRIGRMLAACGLSETDYHLLQLPTGKAVAWHQLRDKAAPELVILLGPAPQQLGIVARLAANQLTGFDGRSWIVSAAPDTFFSDDTLRGHVWNHCLKPFFRL